MPHKTKEAHAAWKRAYRRRKRAEQKQAEAPVADLFEWLESTLKIPFGPLISKPFIIPRWQRRFIVEAERPQTVEASLSVARKNGKSGLIAGYLLAHLVGPRNRAEWRAIVVSLTGQLAGELRDAMEKQALMSGLGDHLTIRRTPRPGHIIGLAGARVDFLAADRSSGHAVGADVVVIDEAGLLQERDRHIWEAVTSALGGREGGRLIAISIRGTGPMFYEMRSRADGKKRILHEYTADPALAIDDPEAWRQANPGLADGIKSLSYMRSRSEVAAVTPAAQAHFEAHDLNRTADPGQALICTRRQWAACTVERLPERAGPVVIGLDLGGSASMTAAAAYWPISGRLEAWGAFADDPPLLRRGETDGVGDLYIRMQKRGELILLPGKVTPVDAFLRHVAGQVQAENVYAVVCDRFRSSEMEQAARECGLSWPVLYRGMGYRDGSEDVRGAQQEIFSRKMKTVESLLLEAAIANSQLVSDDAGNQKLTRKGHGGRIDALAAAVLALACGRRARGEKENAPFIIVR